MTYKNKQTLANEPEPTVAKLEIKKDKRNLKCRFTDAEVLTLGRDLAEDTERLEQIAADKKSVTKEFDAKIAEVEAKIQSKSGFIRNGYEYRLVDITETIGEPNENAKTVRRMDTGETVETRELTPEEKQRKLDFEKEQEAEAQNLPLE